MSFNYTKEMVLQEFKDATAKDEKSNKKTYVNRINYLKVFGKTYADQKAHERKMYGTDKEEETLN